MVEIPENNVLNENALMSFQAISLKVINTVIKLSKSKREATFN